MRFTLSPKIILFLLLNRYINTFKISPPQCIKTFEELPIKETLLFNVSDSWAKWYAMYFFFFMWQIYTGIIRTGCSCFVSSNWSKVQDQLYFQQEVIPLPHKLGSEILAGHVLGCKYSLPDKKWSVPVGLQGTATRVLPESQVGPGRIRLARASDCM